MGIWDFTLQFLNHEPTLDLYIYIWFNQLHINCLNFMLSAGVIYSNLMEMSKCPPNPSLMILCKVENRMSFKFRSNFEM